MSTAPNINVDKPNTLGEGAVPTKKNSLVLLLKAMRPKQWAKNLIAYAPLLFATKAHHGDLFFLATLCVISFCFVSGAIYLLNDVLDADADRIHPTKRFRPIASGQLSKHLAVFACIMSICLGLGIAYLVRPSLCLIVIAYLALSFSYTTVLKHTAILDVFGIAGGFVLRAVGGAIAVAVAPSGWFLLCTTLGALFLALEKRRQELIVLGNNSFAHRKSLGLYSPELLNRLEGIVVPSLVTSYAFYSFLSKHGEAMLLTVPFVLYGVMRYKFLSFKSTITGSPEEVLLKDRAIQVTIVLWVLTCAAVIYGGPAWFHEFANSLDTNHSLIQWASTPNITN